MVELVTLGIIAFQQAAKRNEAIRDRRSAAALVIQGTARNKQASNLEDVMVLTNQLLI